MEWTVEGKSVVSTYPGFHLRVKRLSKGRYWWCVSAVEGVGAKGRSLKKVRDGIAHNGKEGRNECEAGLCGVSKEYVAELRGRRLQGRPWYRLSKDFRPRVGRHLIATNQT